MRPGLPPELGHPTLVLHVELNHLGKQVQRHGLGLAVLWPGEADHHLAVGEAAGIELVGELFNTCASGAIAMCFLA